VTQQSCEACEFFAPAWSHTDRPTWGQCLKLVRGRTGDSTEKARPLFTWADGHCDDLQMPRQAALPSLGRE
jgi:hypothetical protein